MAGGGDGGGGFDLETKRTDGAAFGGGDEEKNNRGHRDIQWSAVRMTNSPPLVLDHADSPRRHLLVFLNGGWGAPLEIWGSSRWAMRPCRWARASSVRCHNSPMPCTRNLLCADARTRQSIGFRELETEKQTNLLQSSPPFCGVAKATSSVPAVLLRSSICFAYRA